jgi:hypothetical protein
MPHEIAAIRLPLPASCAEVWSQLKGAHGVAVAPCMSAGNSRVYGNAHPSSPTSHWPLHRMIWNWMFQATYTAEGELAAKVNVLSRVPSTSSGTCGIRTQFQPVHRIACTNHLYQNTDTSIVRHSGAALTANESVCWWWLRRAARQPGTKRYRRSGVPASLMADMLAAQHEPD